MMKFPTPSLLGSVALSLPHSTHEMEQKGMRVSPGSRVCHVPFHTLLIPMALEKNVFNAAVCSLQLIDIKEEPIIYLHAKQCKCELHPVSFCSSSSTVHKRCGSLNSQEAHSGVKGGGVTESQHHFLMSPFGAGQPPLPFIYIYFLSPYVVCLTLNTTLRRKRDKILKQNEIMQSESLFNALTMKVAPCTLPALTVSLLNMQLCLSQKIIYRYFYKLGLATVIESLLPLHRVLRTPSGNPEHRFYGKEFVQL